MGFLDKDKDTSKQMGEKAQHLAESGQDKFDDFQTDKQISALKEEIGDLVYRARAGNAPTDADARITRIVAEIRAAEATKAAAASDRAGPLPDA